LFPRKDLAIQPLVVKHFQAMSIVQREEGCNLPLIDLIPIEHVER
jgi:hypothetical protein